MKKVLFICVAFISLTQLAISQDVYKKRYYVNDKVKFRTQLIEGKSSGIVSLAQENKKEIHPSILELAKKGKLKANVLFEGNKLYINPWLLPSKKEADGYIDRDEIYFYELRNRQTVKLRFRQWTFNVATVPLKIRFGENGSEFSTGVNLGALIGHTWGKTKFVHRKKIGNKQYDAKFTFGGFFGVDKLEFSFTDGNATEQKVKTAFTSLGLGFVYTYQKFTAGVTSGFDFAMGENSTEWTYNKRPWVGLALGYSLLSL